MLFILIQYKQYTQSNHIIVAPSYKYQGHVKRCCANDAFLSCKNSACTCSDATAGWQQQQQRAGLQLESIPGFVAGSSLHRRRRSFFGQRSQWVASGGGGRMRAPSERGCPEWIDIRGIYISTGCRASQTLRGAP